MNVRWKVDSGETNLRQGSFGNNETSSLSYYRDDYNKAQQRSICENYSLSQLQGALPPFYTIKLRCGPHALLLCLHRKCVLQGHSIMLLEGKLIHSTVGPFLLPVQLSSTEALFRASSSTIEDKLRSRSLVSRNVPSHTCSQSEKRCSRAAGASGPK